MEKLWKILISSLISRGIHVILYKREYYESGWNENYNDGTRFIPFQFPRLYGIYFPR